MASYIETVFNRHFQNYCFSFGIYAHDSKLLHWHYHNSLKELNQIVERLRKTGAPAGELYLYHHMTKNKINHYYHSRVSLVY